MNNRSSQQTVPGLQGAAVFYVTSFGISWAIWGILILFPQTADWAPLIILLGAYGPLLAALLLNRVFGGSGAVRGWLRSVGGVRKQWRWILLGAFSLPLIIAAAHLLLLRLFVGPFTLSADPPWYWAASAVPLNILILFWMSSAVEEFGWQGFALPRLTERVHPLPACLIHGLLWGTWHLPLYLTGAWSAGYQSIGSLYAITLTLAPTLFWLTQRAGGSVIPAVLLHAATNHYSALFMEEQTYPIFGEPLSASFVEIKVAIYLAIALVLIVTTRGRLGLPEESIDAVGDRLTAPAWSAPAD